MKILNFEVHDLHGHEGVVGGAFNTDLNILTGRNGSGKTSVLKLIWYIISGNMLQALREVVFREATVETTEYRCTVYRLSRATCRVQLRIDGRTFDFEDERDDEDQVIINAEDAANNLIVSRGSSVFLPTFRRIEGGFTIDPARNSGLISRAFRQKNNDVEDALEALAKRLTIEPHVFVSAISTADIVGLLLRRYTELSDEYNRLQQQTSQEVIDSIKSYESGTKEGVTTSPEALLDSIRTKIEGTEDERERIMAPIDAVRERVEHLFTHTGIKFGTRLNFGDAASAVNSDFLSAGEKQMLSFICYNAFYQDAIFLIDEPELSLHPDWQRSLFGLLLSQQPSNQFIIATHSPFIYSKFPEKEIAIVSDRGDAESPEVK